MSYEPKNEADLGFLRDAPESADATHMKLLDGRISAPALIRDGLSACGKEVDLWRKAWRDAATDLLATINAGIVDGWAAKKDDLLKPDCAELVKTMLANPSFSGLSECMDKLGRVVDVVKNVQSDSCGAWWDAGELKEAKQAIANGSEFVAITYAIYTLTIKIPALPDYVARKAAVDKLKSEVAAKGCALGASLEAECSRLSAPQAG
eukprot:12925704-Alexandrium_andersonii.AAC.1